MSDWTILCDFDGTIAVDDITDGLLDRFGTPGWQALESDWRVGKIGSRECMSGQVALLDMSRDELDAHLATRAIDPAFAAFVDQAHEAGLHIEVLSDGLDYAINSILARNRMNTLPVVANRLQPVSERGWQLTSPFASHTCRVASGTCKCARADRSRTSGKRVLMIGDGASDFCVAETADFVFAKGKLIAHCIARKIPHSAMVGFADARALLPALLSGELTQPTILPFSQEAVLNA